MPGIVTYSETPPADGRGQAGDTKGMITVTSNAIYYTMADYDGQTIIWHVLPSILIPVRISAPPAPVITSFSTSDAGALPFRPIIYGTNTAPPTITGATSSKSQIYVYINGVLDGSTYTTGTTWSYQPLRELLPGGNFIVTAKANYVHNDITSSLVSLDSNSFNMLLSVPAPQFSLRVSPTTLRTSKVLMWNAAYTSSMLLSWTRTDGKYSQSPSSIVVSGPGASQSFSYFSTKSGIKPIYTVTVVATGPTGLTTTKSISIDVTPV